jgi:hypothetical protein
VLTFAMGEGLIAWIDVIAGLERLSQMDLEILAGRHQPADGQGRSSASFGHILSARPVMSVTSGNPAVLTRRRTRTPPSPRLRGQIQPCEPCQPCQPGGELSGNRHGSHGHAADHGAATRKDEPPLVVEHTVLCAAQGLGR